MYGQSQDRPLQVVLSNQQRRILHLFSLDSQIGEAHDAAIPIMRTTTRLLMSTLFTLSAIHSTLGQDGSLGQFDGHTDVGSPKIQGSASYDPASETYTLTGAGANMWSTNDEFQFLWKKMKGDFIVRARVEFVGAGVEPHRKIGWMARASLDSDASYVDAVEHGVGLTSLQYRLSAGSNTDQQVLSISNADIIQLERRGNNYTFSAAHSGETFVSTNFSVDLPDRACRPVHLLTQYERGGKSDFS